LYASTPMSTSRVTAFAASLVCNVDSTRWPVSDAWTGDLRGLLVPDFADEHDVGILAENRPQRGSKG